MLFGWNDMTPNLYQNRWASTSRWSIPLTFNTWSFPFRCPSAFWDGGGDGWGRGGTCTAVWCPCQPPCLSVMAARRDSPGPINWWIHVDQWWIRDPAISQQRGKKFAPGHIWLCNSVSYLWDTKQVLPGHCQWSVQTTRLQWSTFVACSIIFSNIDTLAYLGFYTLLEREE